MYELEWIEINWNWDELKWIDMELHTACYNSFLTDYISDFFAFNINYNNENI